MKGKGRYGQFIRWIFSGIDFLILNIIYLVVCWFEPANSVFFSKQVWMLLNLSYFVVAYFFSDIHERRVVYA
ncbi:MAG: undecaprenyl-phosphate glucose phosphotransferase, partial [Muribaculaceae bacterium]|nr:undecaprenyl-phosphate glucose phosphotransferase [Muribaculaceae bacterium]